MRQTIGKILCLSWALGWLYAQQTDTTSYEDLSSFILLDSTETALFDQSKELYQLNTDIATSTNSNNTLAQALLFESPLHLKMQSPSGLSSAGFAGGKASHTSLVWNGFKVDAPTLGMSDLAQISPQMFSRTTLEMDPNGSIYGSGAVNALIHLGQDPQFQKTLKISTTAQYTSLPLNWVNSVLALGNAKIYSKSFIRYAKGAQNYAYPLTHRPQLLHNDLENLQLAQDLFIKTQENAYLHVSYWGLLNTQMLPPADFALENHSFQKDEHHQLSIRYRKLGTKAWSIGAFYKNAYNQFIDSTKNISSTNPFQITALQSEVTLLHYKDYQLHLISQIDYAWSNSPNYSQTAETFGVKTNLSDEWKINKKWTLKTSLGIDYLSALWIPSFYSQVEHQLHPKIKVNLGANTSFRAPTFNERFWNPGGNENLKPEKGYHIFNTWNFQIYQGKKHQISLQYNQRFRNIEDLIIWIPTGQFTTGPVNLQLQRYWGHTIRWRQEWKSKNISIQWNIFGSYHFNQYYEESSNRPVNANFYLPQWIAGTHIDIQLFQSTMRWESRFQSEVYYSDIDFMDAFGVHNLHLAHAFKIKKYHAKISAGINNIFNTAYHYMPMYYMPLRNYQITLNINFNHYENN